MRRLFASLVGSRAPSLLWPLALAGTLAPLTAATAQEQPLICFGNEPFWSLDLSEPGKAAFSTPDSAPIGFVGEVTTLAHRRESVWRGRSPASGEADLVAFLREGACSDTMSDTTHPFSVSVSMPDGRHLAGCCRLTQAAALPAALADGSWQLLALSGQPVAGGGTAAVTVTFDAGRVQGFAGCNQFSGSYTLDGQTLALGDLASTMMACPEPAMAAERSFLAAFSGTLSAAIAEGTLSLTPQAGGEPLQFTRAAAPRLEGIEWEVTGYNNGRQAVVSIKAGSSITLRFQGGEVSGNSGCNSFSGEFAATGDSLTVGQLRTTRRACEPGLMTQEQAFLAALQSATTWTVTTRGMLDVHRPDGERVLTASPVGE
jgi:heat shock protein HslJ